MPKPNNDDVTVTAAEEDNIGSALLRLAQIQVDFEDLEADLVQQINQCFVGAKDRNHLYPILETQLDTLK